MRRAGPSFLVILLFCALAFWGGIQWERRNCGFDFPGAFDQIDNSIRCRGFQSDLPEVPDVTLNP
jgi:hypothetical protein